MHAASRWIGLSFCGALVLGALASRDSLASFADTRGLGLTLGLTFGGLWASFGHRRVFAAFASAFAGRAGDDGSAVLSRARVLGWSSGGLACLVGVLLELSAMESPAALATGLARASLSILYGALLAELVFANLRHWVAEDARGASSRAV